MEELPQPKMSDEEDKRTYPLINSIVLWLKIGAVAFTCLIVALFIGLLLVKSGFDKQRDKDNKEVQEQQARIAEDLLQRRIDGCNRDNIARAGQRELASTSATSAQAFASILVGDREITPAIEEALKNHNEKVVKPFLLLADPVNGPFKERDCSPESVQNGG